MSWLRGVVGIVLAIIILLDPTANPDLTGGTARHLAQIALATAASFLVVALVDLVLGTVTWFGHNWARC